MDEQPTRAHAVRGIARVLHVLWALALATVIVLPNLPSKYGGEVSTRLVGWLRPLSFAQSWRMYAPDPQRAQSYMNLTAHYEDGREVELEETIQERNGWRATWAGDKTRVDIWRHYANFRPKKANENRKWYLRAVCVREARKGEVPTKIVMHLVRRSFTAPHKVAAGKPDLGKPSSRLIERMPCRTARVMKMIEEDRALRGQG